ncbi:ATP-dependent Lon protease [Sporosarcina sp. FSL K6-1522]|uniref:ATP-dependent Lon protease n=1 Tax=Sporosarcina sp. FSL K6-1522 TaxID=2921554 RepID=UPI00315B22B7
MKLLLSVLFAGLLGILAFLGPIGIYILCAIIVGVIFRSFILINEIHKQVVPINGNDRVKEAYERYIKERGEKEKDTNGERN